MNGVRLSRPGDEAALKEIWSASFPGDEAFADWFLNAAYAPENALVYEADGRVAAMLHLLPVDCSARGRAVSAFYVYAVATMRAYRGRGVAAALLEAATGIGAARGAKLLLLVPQSEGLFEYYRRQGFETAFFRARRTIHSGGAIPPGLEIVEAPDLTEMDACYETALTGRDHVARTQADWARATWYLHAVGVRRDGGLEGYAVYEPGGAVRELIALDAPARRALELCALDRLNEREADCFGPEGPGEPYGMARAIEPGLFIRNGYAGLMLD